MLGRSIDMRLLLASLLLLLVPTSARAMGVYKDLELVTSNADGSSALVVRTTTSSGTVGMERVYIVVSAREAIVAKLSSTLDPDVATEQVGERACRVAARKLARALAAHHITGVDVRADRCKSAARDIVAVRRVTRVARPALAIVFDGENGDGSGPARATVTVAGSVTDLRDVE